MCLITSGFFLAPLPVWCPSLSVLVDVQQELRGVNRGGGAGVQEQLLVLGQVLGWVLLGQPGTVEQLPLKEWQVRLWETAPCYWRKCSNSFNKAGRYINIISGTLPFIKREKSPFLLPERLSPNRSLIYLYNYNVKISWSGNIIRTWKRMKQ